MTTTNILRASALALLVAGALAAPVAALAQEGPWLVPVRAVNLDPANTDSTGLNLGINSKVIPEVDISRFFTPNIAAELVLTVSQKHTITSNGAGINYTRFTSVNSFGAKVGSLKIAPWLVGVGIGWRF